MLSIVNRLLRRHTSKSRVAAFLVSNFIGLAIVAGALQFYFDAGSIWQDEDSFIRSDYLVVNKRVTAGNTLGAPTFFSEEDISDIESQPWVREVGEFESADYRVYATLSADMVDPSQGESSGGSLSTAMFLEAVPSRFLDVNPQEWQWTPESADVPIIMSKDYLALYNFGFASSAGMPQLSESLVSGLPLQLRLISEDGTKSVSVTGRVAGYSSRFNTILVPDTFMNYTNAMLASIAEGKRVENRPPTRLIIAVSSPGDAAIAPYLESHGMEMAGDKRSSSASYLLKVITGIILAVGGVITLLSLFILMLSISLLMEKNKPVLHSLLMLGYSLKQVGKPYRSIVTLSSVVAAVVAFGAVLALRAGYLTPLMNLGAKPAGLWPSLIALTVLTGIIILCNIKAVGRRVRACWR